MDWNLKTDQCTGCCACLDVCPVGAITMEVDESGSRRPQLNNSLCISCAKCKKVCPQFSKVKDGEIDKKAYIGICENDSLYQKSSSGGIFAAIALSFLERGGVVYGAAVTHNNKGIDCHHIRISDKKDIPLIQGSKYAQSKMDGIYKRIKEDIKGGNKVLFSGTSCQVAAIKNVIGENENLVTIDLVCHGVPKDEIFYSYINFLESRYKACIKDLSFRIKGYRCFWSDSSYVLKLSFTGKKSNRLVYIPKDKSAYYKLFLQRASYRESCYTCQYASLNKPADLTLGDFRPTPGESHEYKLQHARSYSSIIIHTSRGKALLDSANCSLQLAPIPINKMVIHHNNLQHPSTITDEGKLLIGLYNQKGVEGLQGYLDRNYLKNQVRLALRKNVKRIKNYIANIRKEFKKL